MKTQYLEYLLIAVAIGQLMVSVINLFLVRLLEWEDEIKTLPLLMREVIHVHKWFITITLVIFGTLTLRFAGELAAGENELGVWLAIGIGLFWGIRTLIQWFYYDWSHWRGQPGRLAVHWILTFAYGGCAIVYLGAAFLPTHA